MQQHISIKKMSIPKGELYTRMYREAHNGTYVAYLRGVRCKTEDDFFREVSTSLQFPYYFGENWAALDECLCDLEWLCLSGILIVIDDFSLLFSGQEERQLQLQDRVVNYFAVMADYWEAQKLPVNILLNN